MKGKTMTWKEMKKSPVFWVLAIGLGGLAAWGTFRFFSNRKQLPGGQPLDLPFGNDAGGYLPDQGGSGWLDQKPAGVPTNLQDPGTLQNIFNLIKQAYGSAIAKNVERIYRLETSHFKSGQYLRTGSAGMVASKDTYPFGWNSLKGYWDSDSRIKPVGLVRYNKNGQIYSYLAFPQGWGFVALAEILKQRGNNAGSWYSTNPALQSSYQQKLNNITLHYT